MNFFKFPNMLNDLCEFYKILNISPSSAETETHKLEFDRLSFAFTNNSLLPVEKSRKDAFKISKIRKLKIETVVCIFPIQHRILERPKTTNKHRMFSKTVRILQRIFLRQQCEAVLPRSRRSFQDLRGLCIWAKTELRSKATTFDNM